MLLVKPIIDNTVTSVVFKPDENVTLKCLARLNPIGRVLWYHNNEFLNVTTISKNSIKQLDYNENEYQQSILQILEATGSHVGVYKCVLRNEIGVAEHSIALVDVSVKPSPYDLKAENVSFTNILLSWKINSNESDLEFQVAVNENEGLIRTKMHSILIESNFFVVLI